VLLHENWKMLEKKKYGRYLASIGITEGKKEYKGKIIG